MSKTFFDTDSSLHPTPLVRMIGIHSPCTICKESTQMDPYSKYFFGVCCQHCKHSLETRYSIWLIENRMYRTEDTKKTYLNMIKEGLKVN